MTTLAATLLAWLNRAVIFGAIIMYGAMGETLTEKSGNMNLGTPGTMCVGGACGFVGCYLYELNASSTNALVIILIGLLSAFAGGALCGVLFSVLTTTLKVNQNVVGLALTIFGSGVARFMGMFVVPSGATAVKAIDANKVFNAKLGIAQSTGAFGKIFFNYGFMMYLAIVLAIIMALFLKKTRAGLNLRAVGENPATADAAGINVTRYKYLATVLGSGIAGLGGVYYVLDYNYGGWSTFAGESIEALGWLAVALVIFAAWKPLNLLWGSLIFGVAYWLYNYISAFGGIFIVSSAQSSLLETIPYLVTILVLVIASVRKSKENQGPASLGLSYFREDR